MNNSYSTRLVWKLAADAEKRRIWQQKIYVENHRKETRNKGYEK